MLIGHAQRCGDGGRERGRRKRAGGRKEGKSAWREASYFGQDYTMLSILLLATLCLSQQMPGPFVGPANISMVPCINNCTATNDSATCNTMCKCTPSTINVDVSTRYQTFDGFGTSLAWFAYILGNASDPNRDMLADLFFDPDKGLGLNVVRYDIPGGENPMYNFVDLRATIPSYEPELGNFTWSVDAAQLWFLRAAISRGVQFKEAFTNSPPYWMTYSGSATGNHEGYENLDVRFYGHFVDYMVTSVQHFRDNFNISFQTLELFNEPLANYWHFGGTQEGCRISLSTQQTIVPMLAQALLDKKLNTTITASDDETVNQTFYTTQAFNQTGVISNISKINTHTYSGSMRTELYNLTTTLNKTLWMSEYGDGDPAGLNTTHEIMEDLQQMRPSAWCYWQAVDTISSGWGFISANVNTLGNYTYVIQPKYYVMAQFTKFLRPGFTFVNTTDTAVVAAVQANTLVIVSSKCGANTFNVSSFGPAPRTVQFFHTVPWQGIYYQPAGNASVVNGMLTFNVTVGGLASIELMRMS